MALNFFFFNLHCSRYHETVIGTNYEVHAVHVFPQKFLKLRSFIRKWQQLWIYLSWNNHSFSENLFLLMPLENKCLEMLIHSKGVQYKWCLLNTILLNGHLFYGGFITTAALPSPNACPWCQGYRWCWGWADAAWICQPCSWQCRPHGGALPGHWTAWSACTWSSTCLPPHFLSPQSSGSGMVL